jgi:hypothetical protein
VVVADQPLDAGGHRQVVAGEPIVGACLKLHGHPPAPGRDGGLVAGGGDVVGDPADELDRGAEVVELVELADPVAVALPARQPLEGGGEWFVAPAVDADLPCGATASAIMSLHDGTRPRAHTV